MGCVYRHRANGGSRSLPGGCVGAIPNPGAGDAPGRRGTEAQVVETSFAKVFRTDASPIHAGMGHKRDYCLYAGHDGIRSLGRCRGVRSVEYRNIRNIPILVSYGAAGMERVRPVHGRARRRLVAASYLLPANPRRLCGRVCVQPVTYPRRVRLVCMAGGRGRGAHARCHRSPCHAPARPTEYLVFPRRRKPAHRPTLCQGARDGGARDRGTEGNRTGTRAAKHWPPSNP